MQRDVLVHRAEASAEFFRLYFGETQARRYVFGINEYAENVARAVDIDGFIDDFTTATTWLDKPVHRLRQVPPDSLVLSCVTANFAITALAKLAAAGIRHFADYYAIADASGGQLPQVHAVAETRQDYLIHGDNYRRLRDRLVDDSSRETFDRLLDFRLNADLRAMTAFSYAADRQYFEPFLDLHSRETFVDGGGFDGQTSRQFATHCPDYGVIHLFEPSAKMIATAQKELADLNRVTYHQLGLYEYPARLCFDAGSGSASRISDHGMETIDVARLDDVVAEPVSFIKLDLEGAELAALRGARRHIVADHPKLAIAVYHHPQDFWQIPDFILGLRDDYRLYLRHYTEGWTETVMFFIPS